MTRGIYMLMHSDLEGLVNIGCPQYVTVDELVGTVAQVAGKGISIRHVEGPVRVRSRNFSNTLSGEGCHGPFAGARQLALDDGIAVLDEGHPRDLPALVAEALHMMLVDEDARAVIEEGAKGDLSKFLSREHFKVALQVVPQAASLLAAAIGEADLRLCALPREGRARHPLSPAARLTRLQAERGNQQGAGVADPIRGFEWASRAASGAEN